MIANVHRQKLGWAIVCLFLLQFSSAFRLASWNIRNTVVVPAGTRPRSFYSFRRNIIQTPRPIGGALKMALDLGSANDLILAATETASTASKSPEVQSIMDLFNSAGVQSILKELKAISANTPISEIQALIAKVSASAEVKHLLQDIQSLQNKVKSVQHCEMMELVL